MALNFPNAPAVDDVFTDATAGLSWTWDGEKWLAGRVLPYVLPPVTATTLGGVIADGVTINVAGDGTISALALPPPPIEPQLLAVLTGEGPRITTSGPPSSLLPPAALFTAPPNFFTVGKTLRAKMRGHFIAPVATSTWGVHGRIGAAQIPAASTVLNQVGDANTEYFFSCDAILTCRQIGTNAMVTSTALLTGNLGAIRMSVTFVRPTSGTIATGQSFDSTIPNLIDIFGQMTGVLPVGLQLSTYTLEALN